MAKRKRKSGNRKGFQLRVEKDYRSEAYVMYIVKAEIGILQAATMDPELTDGDVNRALEDLIGQLQEPEALTRLLPGDTSEGVQKHTSDTSSDLQGYVQHFILMNLKHAFEEHGPLEAEDVIGVLGVIKTSIKRWNMGMHRRGYLTYLEDFLGQMGITVDEISAEEAEALGITQAFEQLEKGEE